MPIKQSPTEILYFSGSFSDAWQSSTMMKNPLHEVFTEYIQWLVSSRHSGTRQTLALQKHTQKRIWPDTEGLLPWKSHLAAKTCLATQRARARPLSLPLPSCQQHCSPKRTLAGGGWLISTLTWCTLAAQLQRKDLGSNSLVICISTPKTPWGWSEFACPAPTAACRDSYRAQLLECQSYCSLHGKKIRDRTTCSLHWEWNTQMCHCKDQTIPRFLLHMYPKQMGTEHIYKSHCLNVGPKERGIAGSRVWEVLPLGRHSLIPPAHSKVQQVPI